MSRLRARTVARFACIGGCLIAPTAVAQELQDLGSGTTSDRTTVVVAESSPIAQDTLRTKPLSIPNTSVVGVGTTQVPVDMTQGRLPAPIPLPFGPDRYDGWSYSNKGWVPPAFCHQPTYYEDIMLENHGHETCPPLQPILSGARFYSGVFFTPYFYCLNGPLQDVSSVGRYRPGSVAPGLRQRPPYDPHALGTQALSTGAGVLLLRP